MSLDCVYGMQCMWPQTNGTLVQMDCCDAINNTCALSKDAFAKSTSSFGDESHWIWWLILLSFMGNMLLYFIIKADSKL